MPTVSIADHFCRLLKACGAYKFDRATSYNIHVCFFAVRSYGTEDRPTEKQVGPRSEVYEYIVFRGSDIKDLHVSKGPKKINTVNQDPSILQVCYIIVVNFEMIYTCIKLATCEVRLWCFTSYDEVKFMV